MIQQSYFFRTCFIFIRFFFVYFIFSIIMSLQNKFFDSFFITLLCKKHLPKAILFFRVNFFPSLTSSLKYGDALVCSPEGTQGGQF